MRIQEKDSHMIKEYDRRLSKIKYKGVSEKIVWHEKYNNN